MVVSFNRMIQITIKSNQQVSSVTLIQAFHRFSYLSADEEASSRRSTYVIQGQILNYISSVAFFPQHICAINIVFGSETNST